MPVEAVHEVGLRGVNLFFWVSTEPIIFLLIFE